MSKWRHPTVVLLLIGAGVLALDQGTKALVLHSDRLLSGRHFDVIPACFQIVLVHNPGAAWGMLAGRQHVLALISLAVAVLLVVTRARLSLGWRERDWALGLILGGIVGNLIDRVCRPGVVDFLRFFIRTSTGEHEWPSFNVADSAICVGVTVFILSTFLRPDGPPPAPAGTTSTPAAPPAA